MQNKIDFKAISSYLLDNIRTIIPEWLPGGRLMGTSYSCSDIMGGKGTSFKVNLENGIWQDFATGQKGGDLVSLYAAINSMNQVEAAKRLDEQYTVGSYTPAPRKKLPQEVDIIAPPKGTELPKEVIKAENAWIYKDFKGNTLFAVCRYNKKDGGKFFSPWSYSESKGWVMKSWPEPRPLYGLELLNNSKPVLIVEGEKSAVAAREMINGAYSVVTWSSGSNSYNKTDWRPVHGRKVLIWPDADDPGIACGNAIAKMLVDYCPEIKILDVGDIEQKGWDAADSSFTFKEFVAWAKPRVRVVKGYCEKTNTNITGKPELDEPQRKTLNERVISKDLNAWAVWDEIGLKVNQNTNTPHYNVDNAIIVLENYSKVGDHLWFDEFHSKYFTDLDYDYTTIIKEPREINDVDFIDLTRMMQSELSLVKMTKTIVQDAIMSYANKNRKNEPKDWMETLKWDGKHRVKRFFHEYCGAIDTEYTSSVSKNFWVSMVARVFMPGCKADNMVILEGKQGAMKSSALEVIGGDWYASTSESPSSKDFFQTLQGTMILEIAELDSFGKADRNTIKKVLSTAKDRYRPSYGKTAQNFPRRCIFAGTTNEDHYLNDPTGARRFWPVRVTNIHIEAIRQDREQLFAEAVSLFNDGEDWYEVPYHLAKEVQDSRRESDIWEEEIAKWLDSHAKIDPNEGRYFTTIHEIATQCLRLDPSQQTRSVKIRIGNILRSIGCEGKQGRLLNSSVREWRYYFELQRF